MSRIMEYVNAASISGETVIQRLGDCLHEVVKRDPAKTAVA